MRQKKNLVGLLLALPLSLTACGSDHAVAPGIDPTASDYPPVSGLYSLKSSDCQMTTSPLSIRQSKALLSFQGGFDYGVTEWTGYVLSDKKVYFTIHGTTETLTCQAPVNGTELEGSCTLESGGTCRFAFTRTGDVPPSSDQDGDGVADDKDNCPDRPNTPLPGFKQPDLDGDGKGDVCDDDIDGDGRPNSEDMINCVPVGNDIICVLSGVTDADGDGIKDVFDNCTAISNPDQKDSNHNGIGDACAIDKNGNGLEDIFEVSN